MQPNNTLIDQKLVLITGATSGIGLNLARSLSLINYNLVLTGRNKNCLSDLYEEFDFINKPYCKTIAADLTLSEDIRELVFNTPKLDGIVLNAGIIEYTPAKMITIDKIKKIFNINFYSNVLLIQELLKNKKISKNASIVFISSISALSSVVGTSLYAASKAAINSYAKVLANELASQKIRVNVISPGVVKTKIIENENVISEQQQNNLEALHPLGLGDTTDVTALIEFLLSNKSKWITGSNIVIDGGYLIK